MVAGLLLAQTGGRAQRVDHRPAAEVQLSLREVRDPRRRCARHVAVES